MQVNAVQATLTSLHSAYNSCLRSRVDDFLANDPVKNRQAFNDGMKEFCVDEKKQWLNFMEKNDFNQFQQIMRLEGGNM